ncbi:Vps62-related protein [Janthinobacterium sp. SUN128]|uniref:Vps62-related protein n=1 Tax=Janthinobacterium sp. SUN128 TaxID=3014790 RepID=UPI002712CFCC|nr:Vps62-related protein [Janthinobacterium sp. SUN128]MDO8033520.1 Vps62-related protein [Janthinobacterium sp. SUN128]
MLNDNNDASDATLALAPYNEKANAAIVKAVRATDWTRTAVRYGEICLTLGKPEEFTEVWSQLDLSKFPPDLNNMPWIGLYQFTGSGQRDANCLPVGDIAVSTRLAPPYQPPRASPMFYLSPCPEATPSALGPALAHPTGFRFLVNDRGSKNPRDICYWQPIAPDGYYALGICFNPREPDISKYWCVRKDLCMSVDKIRVWQEHGWQGSGSVEAPKARPDKWKDVQDGYVLLSPLAYTYGGLPAFYLRLPMACLDVEPFDFPAPQKPELDPAIVVNHKLKAGLSPVVIVPFTAIPGDASNVPDQPYTSPFYFIAAQPYYFCYNVLSPTGGGTTTTTYRVGVTKEESTTFERSTSITTNVEVGAVFEGPSASASLSMTNTFSLTQLSGRTEETSVEYSEQLIFKETARVWQWQLLTDLVVTRSDGTQIRPIAYRNQDRTNIPPPDKASPPETMKN